MKRRRSSVTGFGSPPPNSFIAGLDPLEYCKEFRKYLIHCHIKDVSESLAAAARGEETGIGSLTDEQIADSIRFRKRADGANLFIMPAYAGMADQDVADLIAYLRSQEPVENAIPDRELAFEPPAFEVAEMPPAVAPTDPVARGQYLTTLANCTFCHTPKNEDGSPIMDMLLAGAPFRSMVAPNLTPDDATGLGLWTDEELAEFLATGLYSDGSEVGQAMKNVVDRGIGQLTDADREAIVAYLRSLPAIENLPATPQ